MLGLLVLTLVCHLLGNESWKSRYSAVGGPGIDEETSRSV